MRRIYSIFIILLWALETSAQLPSGIWVSSHELRVGTYFGQEVEDERMAKYLKRFFAEDSVYTEGSHILVTEPSGKVQLLKDIRSSFVENEYAAENPRLALGRDTFRIADQSASMLLLNKQMIDSIWFENAFHRLPDSGLDPSASNMAFPEAGAHLQLHVTDTLDRSFQLDFIDQRQVIITGAKDGMPYTLRGTWHSRWIGNTLFFAFFDNHIQGMQLYYFFADSAKALIGGSYNDAKTMQAVPRQLKLALTHGIVADSAAIGKIRNDLIGPWHAVNDPLFYDPAIEFGFLSYQSFEIEFNSDSTFHMLKSGSILKNGDSIPLEETSRGEWEVSATGRYIVLRPADDIPFYFTIEKATSEELDVHCFMKTLSEFPYYNVFENRRVELRRKP